MLFRSEIKSDLVVEYGTPCLDKAGQVVMVDLPEGTDPHSYYPVSYTHLDVYKRQVYQRGGQRPVHLYPVRPPAAVAGGHDAVHGAGRCV